MLKRTFVKKISSLFKRPQKVFPELRPPKRVILSSTKQKALLGYVKKLIADKDFLRKVEWINEDRVAKFQFEGVSVIIKDTYGINFHGFNYGGLRKSFLAHQKTLRSGAIKARHYSLRSAKFYGMVDNFLVIEYVDGVNSFQFSNSRFFSKKKSFKKALRELSGNLDKLENQKKIWMPPQVGHTMTTGCKNGKWVFFLPYDYK